MFSNNPGQVFLKNFRFRVNEKFFYEYNFNIDWKHQIRVEKIVDAEQGKYYPQCIGGKNACPPEETKGLVGFQAIHDLYKYPFIDFLKIVKFQEQLGYAYRPDVFNRRIINSVLKKGDYDFINQFDEVVSVYESPYYGDKYWFKKDKFQGLKKMKEFLESWGIEVEFKQDPYGFTFEVVARRFCKKQQMQWSKRGAHLMLQARTKVLNGDLVDCFKKWYPNLKIEQEEVKEAA